MTTLSDLDNLITDLETKTGLALMADPREVVKPELTRSLLTQRDINANPEYMKAGYMPGDIAVSDGSVERKESEEPRGSILLQSEIDASPTLTTMKAKAGDMIETLPNGKRNLVRSGDNDLVRNFMYGFDDSTTLLGDAYRTIAVNAPAVVAPFGGLPDNYEDMSKQDIVDFFATEKAKKMAEKYGDFEPTGGVSQFLGGVAGSADPTWLLPLGATVGRAAAIGGGLGGAGALLEGTAKNDVDLANVAASTVLGAGLGAGVSFGAARLTNYLKNKGKSQVGTEATEQPETMFQTLTTEQAAALKTRKVGMLSEEDKRRIAMGPMAPEKAAENEVAKLMTTESVLGRSLYPSIGKVLDSFVDQMEKISPVWANRVRRFEVQAAKRVGDRIKETIDFNRAYKALPKNSKDTVKALLLNGNRKAAIKEAEQFVPGFGAALGKVTRVLDDMAKELKVTDGGLEGYFPREVTNYNKLREALGGEANDFDTLVADTAAKQGKTVSQLTGEELGMIRSKYLRGAAVKKGIGQTSRNKKARTVDKVDQVGTVEGEPMELLQFYADPVDSLVSYIRRNTEMVERNKVFGLNPAGRGDAETKQALWEAIKDEDISAEGMDRLKEMMADRFITGNQNLGGVLGGVRDLGYMTTIANPISALTNFQDLALTFTRYGLKDTLASLFGPKNIKLIDFAMDDMFASEFISPSATAKWLDRFFRVSGFRRADTLMKETALNASLRNFKNKAKSEKGLEWIKRRYGGLYTPGEFELLKRDLKEGNDSDLVKMLTVGALSEQQPIFRSTNSQYWLANPKGRILYMMKQFMLTQAQFALRETVGEFRAGNKLDSVKNVVGMGVYLTGLGVGVQTVKNIILGRDVDPEEIPETAMWGLLGVAGLNEYSTNRYLSRGDVSGYVTSMLAPAMPLPNALGQVATKTVKGELDELTPEQALRPIPIIGPIAVGFRNWVFGEPKD